MPWKGRSRYTDPYSCTIFKETKLPAANRALFSCHVGITLYHGHSCLVLLVLGSGSERGFLVTEGGVCLAIRCSGINKKRPTPRVLVRFERTADRLLGTVDLGLTNERGIMPDSRLPYTHIARCALGVNSTTM